VQSHRDHVESRARLGNLGPGRPDEFVKKSPFFGLMVRAYLKGLILPRELRQRGTLCGPQKKKKKKCKDMPVIPGKNGGTRGC
jgi:hypothetical protein